MRDYYKILGLAEGATIQEIKEAYRRLSKKFHPDRHQGDKDMASVYADINEAYAALIRDVSSRQQYSGPHPHAGREKENAKHPPRTSNLHWRQPHFISVLLFICSLGLLLDAGRDPMAGFLIGILVCGWLISFLARDLKKHGARKVWLGSPLIFRMAVAAAAISCIVLLLISLLPDRAADPSIIPSLGASSVNPSEQDIAADSFTVQGYASIAFQNRCWDCAEGKSPYPDDRYVFFHITSGMTETLSRFLQDSDGKSFYRNDAIGLGCITDSQQLEAFVADSRQLTKYVVDKATSNAVLHSSIMSPATITLYSPPNAVEGDAPDCFSGFKVVSAAPAVADSVESRSATAGRMNEQSGVISNFYTALRQGDGTAAVQELIPEKRNVGHYTPDGLSSYWSSVDIPLSLTLLLPVDESTWSVAYRYQSKDKPLCSDWAKVSLERRDGNWLISTIVPTNGC